MTPVERQRLKPDIWWPYWLQISDHTDVALPLFYEGWGVDQYESLLDAVEAVLFMLKGVTAVLGLLQLVRSRHSKSAEFLNVLNDQVIPSMDFFFPDGSGIFQDDNAKIHRALVVKEWSMRTHECQGAWGVIFTHELATTESWLYPIKSLWDVLEKTEGMVRLSCHQYKILAKN